MAKNVLRAKPREHRVVGRDLKGGLEFCFLDTETNLIARGSTSDKKCDRIDQEGFACPGFTSQDGKPSVDAQAELLNYPKVGNAQLGEHRSSGRV